ncbi:MAG: hypothetical protein VKK62_08535 [Synechococcaceae cyanobacterium]|nr:hypothetical protein [Synechococcaceae cyanobacterium]
MKVTPIPSQPGNTLWTFSGTSTYSELAPGGRFAGGALSNIIEWKGDSASDYVKSGTYNNYTTSLLSGLISLTVTPQAGGPLQGSIAGLHVDHDNSGDDFGTGLSGADIPLMNGDLVSWSGSGVFAVDIANLIAGSYLFNNYGETLQGSPFGSLPLNLVVSTTPAVPAPLPVLGSAAAFACSRRLRRRIRRAGAGLKP